MVKLSITLAALALLLAPLRAAELWDSQAFKAHLYREHQYRELASLLLSDSSAHNEELVRVLLAQNLGDSAHAAAQRIAATEWTDSTASMRSALGILYCDSALLFCTASSDTCLLTDNNAAWQFTHGRTSGLRFCSAPLREGYTQFNAYQYKSPIIAGALSAAVPGMGRVYAGYRQQFWPSFLASVLLAAAAAETSRYGWTSPQFIGAATVFSIFYAGNIWGTVHLANNHNNNAENTFNTVIELHYRAMLGK